MANPVIQIPNIFPTGADLAKAIRDHPEILGIPHSKLDCQAAVEKALSLVGVVVNYRGSNHMWREMVTNRMSISEAGSQIGELLPGMICFTLKHDGSEVRRGYHDSMGAAVHVGIILDSNTCFQSGIRGTEIIPISQTSFNQVSLCKFLSYPDIAYDEEPDDIIDPSQPIELLEQLRQLLQDAEDKLYQLEDYIKGKDGIK